MRVLVTAASKGQGEKYSTGRDLTNNSEVPSQGAAASSLTACSSGQRCCTRCRCSEERQDGSSSFYPSLVLILSTPSGLQDSKERAPHPPKTCASSPSAPSEPQ